MANDPSVVYNAEPFTVKGHGTIEVLLVVIVVVGWNNKFGSAGSLSASMSALIPELGIDMESFTG